MIAILGLVIYGLPVVILGWATLRLLAATPQSVHPFIFAGVGVAVLMILLLYASVARRKL